MKSLFLDALRCQNSAGRPPIWLMRQAGRYLPQYRALRAKYSFSEMCHKPELAAEITLLPLNIFQFDAAITFSDILVIAEAMGLHVSIEEEVGPIITPTLQSSEDIETLNNHNICERLDFVHRTIQCVKPQLNVPLIGFCGGPFTLASYMVEGKTSRDFKKTKQWMIRDPSSFHQLLTKITHCLVEHLNMQIDAGVDALQIFDSWANVLAHSQFEEFSLNYLEKILQSLKDPTIPVILFCRGSSVFAKDLAKMQPAAISLDWNCHMQDMRSAIPPDIALQGNLDPYMLYAPHAVIRKEVKKILNAMKGEPGYIFNLGHGILPDVSPDAVKVLVECVKSQ